MKAQLIIDMPQNCWHKCKSNPKGCQFGGMECVALENPKDLYENHSKNKELGIDTDGYIKPEWCPLIPIPEKPDYKCGMCEWLKKGNGLYCVCTNGNSNHKLEIRHEYRKACKKGFKLKESENKQ